MSVGRCRGGDCLSELVKRFGLCCVHEREERKDPSLPFALRLNELESAFNKSIRMNMKTMKLGTRFLMQEPEKLGGRERLEEFKFVFSVENETFSATETFLIFIVIVLNDISCVLTGEEMVEKNTAPVILFLHLNISALCLFVVAISFTCSSFLFLH